MFMPSPQPHPGPAQRAGRSVGLRGGAAQTGRHHPASGRGGVGAMRDWLRLHIGKQ